MAAGIGLREARHCSEEAFKAVRNDASDFILFECLDDQEKLKDVQQVELRPTISVMMHKDGAQGRHRQVHIQKWVFITEGDVSSFGRGSRCLWQRLQRLRQVNHLEGMSHEIHLREMIPSMMRAQMRSLRPSRMKKVGQIDLWAHKEDRSHQDSQA